MRYEEYTIEQLIEILKKVHDEVDVLQDQVAKKLLLSKDIQIELERRMQENKI